MNIRDVAKTSRFIVAGHRGFPYRCPENTLISLQEALDSGVGMVEFDIGLSKDKIPVLCHDTTLDRTTTGSGLVSQYDWAELSRLDAGVKKAPQFAGTRIPRLEEVCQWALDYPSILLNIDMKSGDVALQAVDHVMSLVIRYDLQHRSIFNSGDGRVINDIYYRYGFMLEGGMNHFEENGYDAGKKLDAVCVHIDKVTPEVVQRFKQMGKLVWCWGAEDTESFNSAIDAGITLAVCDNPLTCLAVAKKRLLL